MYLINLIDYMPLLFALSFVYEFWPNFVRQISAHAMVNRLVFQSLSVSDTLGVLSLTCRFKVNIIVFMCCLSIIINHRNLLTTIRMYASTFYIRIAMAIYHYKLKFCIIVYITQKIIYSLNNYNNYVSC